MSTPGNGGARKPARRVIVTVSAHDHVDHHTLVSELITRAKRVGVAGVTVFRDPDGRGTAHPRHRHHLLGTDARVRLVVIDAPDVIDRFVEDIGPVIGNATVVLDDVEIIDL